MRINHQIKAEKLLVIDETGKNLGVLSRSEAFALAQQKDLDLIEVHPLANPPVAKIIDYGKFEYQQQKAQRKIKTVHKQEELKNVKIGLKTSLHDLTTKAAQAEKFLNKGHRVRLEIFLRGREKTRRDLAKNKLLDFEKLIQKEHKIESSIMSLPSGWAIIIA